MEALTSGMLTVIIAESSKDLQRAISKIIRSSGDYGFSLISRKRSLCELVKAATIPTKL